jgi:hypothetical protein
MKRSPLALALLVVSACGSNNGGSGADGGPTPDASANHVDAQGGQPDAFVPFTEATHPTPPIGMSAGGSVLATPKIVPVFFTGDSAAQTEIEAFLHALAASSYWPAIASEYGVGNLTIATSVVATEAPPTTDSALQSLLTAHAAGGSGWPANDANTIFAVYLPAGVVLTGPNGTSCTSFVGYHSEVSNIAYATLPRCSTTTFPDLQYVTIATSHELFESASDPHPTTAAAFNSVDADDQIWKISPGTELADMCETTLAAYQPLVGSYMVQRAWSNASAAAGHDPCVPTLATPYVAAAPVLSPVTVLGFITTRGITVAAGSSQVVEVDLYSDAPTADWTVDAIDVASQINGGAAELSFAWDKTTGHNGDKLHLTVTRIKAGALLGASEFGIASKVNGADVGMSWSLAD